MSGYSCRYLTRRFLEEQLLYQMIMYLPLESMAVKDKQTLADIETMAAAHDPKATEDYYPAIQAMLKRRTDLKTTRIRNMSWLDYDGDGKKDHNSRGFVAAVFVNGEADAMFVAYRGTPKGAWLDNAKMLVGSPDLASEYTDRTGTLWRYFSPMQAEALKYVSVLIDNSKRGWYEVSHHFVIGHSKGGNQAQISRMVYPEAFDICISMDGPGMSAETIDEMKQNLGPQRFALALSGLLGIHAANDYVHGLGIPLIPKRQTHWYLAADCTPEILCNHFITAFLDPQTMELVPFDDNGPGPVAQFIERVSQAAMALPLADREDVFMSLMAALQVVLGRSLPVGALGENWLRLILGLEGGSTKAVSLLMSVIGDINDDALVFSAKP